MTQIEITCATAGCGVTFWVTDGFNDRRRDDHKSFHCPNGHVMSYPGQTDEQKLKVASARLLEEIAEKWRLGRKVKELRKLIPQKPPAKKLAKK